MNIKDIARLTGYSTGTVSRVLNHHPDVSEEARRKIQEVIERENYVPNANAKLLKQRSTAIAILIKGTGNLLFADILEKIQTILKTNDEDATVFYLDEDDNEVLVGKQIASERSPRAFIFLGGNLAYFRDDFHGIEVPSVLVTNTAEGLGYPNLSSYTTNDEEAARAMTDYLISKGHMHIGILGGNADRSDTQVSFRRFKGCMDSFRSHGIPFDETRQYEPCRFSLEDGYNAASRLIRKNPDLTAVFALSDLMAMGAMRALRDSGKRVPEDISVAGYDGIALSGYQIPRLTTIRQDTARMASSVVGNVLQRIHYTFAPEYGEIPFAIMPGESVRDLHES